MANTNVGVRLDDQTLARLDELESRLSKPWLKATRSAALRAAILAGLDRLRPPDAPGGGGEAGAGSGDDA